MILRELIANLSRVTISGSTDQEVLSISASSKHIQAGQLFVAIRGTTIDGHTFIEDALRAGATIIMAEKAPPSDLPQTITWLHVPNSRYALAIMASAFYAKPWTELKLAGVTGTNGKTTTTYLIHHIMEKEWHRAGLLGTILIDDGESKHAANHTTPGSLELVDVLQRMKDHACRGAAMEVSSHGIDQDRVAGIGFNACVFTNLTQDHLDYHGTMERYFDAKKAGF